MKTGVDAWIGLGGNLGEPLQTLRAAFEALASLEGCRLHCVSRIYRTPPMGPPGQPDYLNAVAGLGTSDSPEALLKKMQAIEHRLGRRRDGERWGPRVIDLDLLCYRDEQRNSEFLRLPHPGIPERAFVLLPLAELAPALEIPGQGRVDRLLEQVDVSKIRCIEDEPS